MTGKIYFRWWLLVVTMKWLAKDVKCAGVPIVIYSVLLQYITNAIDTHHSPFIPTEY